MMRWTGILVLSLALLLVPTAVQATTSAEVTITATGYVCGAPGDLTLTYISDYEVGISWTKGPDAENTLVRARYGSVPESRTDGYLVYYGNGTNCSDTGVSLDETVAPIYYRAWSENVGGIWEESGISDFFEGGGMLLIGIVVIVLGLTALAFILKDALLHMVCVPAWSVLGILLWNQNWPPGNAYLPTALVLLAISMALVNLVLTVNHYLGQRTAPPTHDEIQSRYKKQIYDMTRKPRDEFWP